MSKNIFIIGADSFNMQKVRKVEIDATFKLHELLSFEEVKEKGFDPVEECLAKTKDRLHGFDVSSIRSTTRSAHPSFAISTRQSCRSA